MQRISKLHDGESDFNFFFNFWGRPNLSSVACGKKNEEILQKTNKENIINIQIYFVIVVLNKK